MFCPLEYREGVLLLRGVVILAFVILVGVSVGQQQLNSLTQRQETMGGVSMTYDPGGNYSMGFFGANYTIKGVYEVGQIITGDRAISIKIRNQRITVPTYIEIDCKKELVMLDLWAKILVEEAFSWKQVMTLYLRTLQEKIHVYTSQLR